MAQRGWRGQDLNMTGGGRQRPRVKTLWRTGVLCFYVSFWEVNARWSRLFLFNWDQPADLIHVYVWTTWYVAEMMSQRMVSLFLLLSKPAAWNASFRGDKFTVDYQVPIFPPSESVLIMFQEVRSLPRVLDTTLAIISPKCTICWQRVAPPYVTDRSDSAADDSLAPHLHWLRSACWAKGGKLAINLFLLSSWPT